MSTYVAEVRWCSTCQDEMFFEQPECPDGHGSDCPELVCVGCGDALVIGFTPERPAKARRGRSVA